LFKTIENYKFELKFHRSNRIKRTTVVLNSQKLVTIKAPISFSDRQFEKIYLKFIPWIKKHIKNAKCSHKFDILSNQTIDFLGKKHKLTLKEKNDTTKAKIVFEDGQYCLYYNKNIHKSYEDFFFSLKSFYFLNSKDIVDNIFLKYIEKTDLKPKKITYKYLKSKWASCSWEDKISFNIMLLQFDIDVISYVVLHELCHIKEKNHSNNFWQLVYKYMPDYKRYQIALKGGIL